MKRARDIRWGSHYGTLISLLGLFPSVIDVLLVIGEDGTLAKQRAQADNLLVLIQCFEFVFTLHLMKTTWELQMICHKHYKEKTKTL